MGCPSIRQNNPSKSLIEIQLLKEAHRLLIVRDKHILILTIVVEHHFVVLAAKAGFFVSAERGVSGVIVIAIYPNTSGLDRTRDTIELVCVTGPNACT